MHNPEKSRRKTMTQICPNFPFQHKASATRHPELANLGWQSKPQLIRGFVQEGSKEDAIRHMADNVDRFGQKSPWSSMLIEHRPSHLNRVLILAFNNAILLSHIWRGKQMLESQRSTKGLKMSIMNVPLSLRIALMAFWETHFATKESNLEHE
jgi:hypothetical protein